MKNSKKNVATNKKAYQAALIKKATAKKTNSTPAVDSVNTDNISTTTDTAPVRKVNGKALQDTFCRTIRQLKPRGNQILRTFSTCY